MKTKKHLFVEDDIIAEKDIKKHRCSSCGEEFNEKELIMECSDCYIHGIGEELKKVLKEHLEKNKEKHFWIEDDVMIEEEKDFQINIVERKENDPNYR